MLFAELVQKGVKFKLILKLVLDTGLECILHKLASASNLEAKVTDLEFYS